MNDKYSTTEGKTSEKLSDEAMLSAQWKNIDWHKAEREVNRLQIRIVKATQQKDYNAVKRLQYLLTHSFYAKALAVKRVVTNDGRRTPGVDGVLWNTPAKKMAAALSLTDKRYRARPLRRVYIEKKDKKKKRPLGIPTMYDRAMQALYALALEPVAETTADGKSFGFRKGRCAQDACEYLFNALSRKHISPKWVLEGDIKGCFDHISHDWLLANIPMDKNILKQFLKAGFIYQRELFPTEEGTPQGGIISPILANMTLDGIEKKLVERFHTNALGKVDSRFKNAHKVNFVRYADDFVVTAATPELALEAKELIREFLAERGLELSDEKTVVTNIDDGFDFLGWNFRKYNEKLIMLCVTNDGRKIGLDVRLMNPILPDDPNSKLNTCVRNVLQIWEDGKEQKLTQLLFCDLSTPKNDGNFNVYDDVRKKLVAAGVPESEVEFIHNADTEAKKAALFSKVRSGDVRVLLGSTAKMGAGTNVQQRLVAVHHLDVGWKPSDMTQRNGRIIRQGNMNKEVKVFNYVTEGTFDSYLFQTLENKQRFISQIMTSKSPVRSCDDVDEQALSYAEIKALCAGNPLIKEKMDLDVQVAKLKVLKADHQSQKFRLEDKLLTKFPADIQETNAYLAGVKADAEVAAAHPQEKEGFCGIIIKGVTYDEKKTAGERLLLACSELPNSEEKVIGSYRGFELSLRFDTYHSEYQALLRGQRKYPVALGKDPLGCIIRLDNSLNNFPERISSVENELATLKQQQAAAQIEVEKPFPQEEELAEKSARLAELNAQLDMDEKSHEPEQDEEPRRSSVLAALEEKSDKVEPIKPFKSYLDKDGDAR